MAAPRAHAAGGGRAGARRDLAGARRRALPSARLRRGAAGRGLHPGRHEPLQRLLRCAPRSRHRGPAGTRARDRRRPRAAEPGAARDVRDFRARGGVRRLPRGRRRPGAARGRRGLDPRRRALHRRPAALRLRGPRRGVRVPVLRHRRRRRLLLRPGPDAAVGGVRLRGSRRAARERDPRREQRPRPRDRPPRGQAHAGRASRQDAHAHALHRDARSAPSSPRRCRGCSGR